MDGGAYGWDETELDGLVLEVLNCVDYEEVRSMGIIPLMHET